MEQKTYEVNNTKYVIDPDIEQVQLVIQIISKYGIEIDVDKDTDEMIGKKLVTILASVMKEGKIGELLSYLFTPESVVWSLEIAKQHEANLMKIKPKEVIGITSDFFTIITAGSFLTNGASSS